MHTASRTAVIGAGISGLVGGNRAIRNANGNSGACRSLRIDTSRDLLHFNDFPTYPGTSHYDRIVDDPVQFLHRLLSPTNKAVPA